jgi:hypothetical protein
MSLPLHSSHFASLQVIENEWFNLLSVIQSALNRISLLLAVLPKLDYSHPQAYRDPWRHK